MEGEWAWKEMTAGSQRGAGVRQGMSPLREAVREIDLWGYEVSLPDADPAFQSSCCGNSYCKKTWSNITTVSFSVKTAYQYG